MQLRTHLPNWTLEENRKQDSEKIVLGGVNEFTHEAQVLVDEAKSLNDEALHVSREDKSITGVAKRVNG